MYIIYFVLFIHSVESIATITAGAGAAGLDSDITVKTTERERERARSQYSNRAKKNARIISIELVGIYA